MPSHWRPPPERHRDYGRDRQPADGHYGRRDRGGYNDRDHPYEYYRPRSYSRSPPRRYQSPPRRYPSPPRNNDMYRFGDYDRRDGGHAVNGNDNFTFRSGQQREFRDAPPPPRREPPRGPRGQRGRDSQRPQGRQHNQPRRFVPKPAHERKILHADNDREGTPEMLEGMATGGSRFKAINDLDISESEDDEESPPSPPPEGEPTAKRVKTDGIATVEEDAKPKWSNPDPYYLLPPVDESRGKRKDVVQLIRKAKVDADKAAAAATANAVTRNADFIGFGDDDLDAEVELALDPSGQAEEGEIDSDPQNPAVPPYNPDPSANTSFSHLRNLHQMPDVTPTHATPDHPAMAFAKNAVAMQDRLDDNRKKITELRTETHALPPKPQFGLQADSQAPSRKQKLDANQRGTKRKHAAGGDIVGTWLPKKKSVAAPWYTDHSTTPDTSLWLHKEICDFYNFIKPRPYEAKMREELVKRLQKELSKTFIGSTLRAFGSFGQGIYLPTSDMDLVLLSQDFPYNGFYSFRRNPKNTLHQIASILERYDIADQSSITVITKAKVPIIKFVDKMTGIHCDLSLDNDSGLKAMETFDSWRRTWPFLPLLLSVLKQWLLMRDLNEVFSGGLGGFSITCMLVSMLQNVAQGETRNVDDDSKLGQLLVDFFNLYGNQFNMNKIGIQMLPEHYFSKATRNLGKTDRWTIIDPNNSTNDLSGGSTKARLIEEKFSDAHALLTRTMRELDSAGPELRKGRSLLQLVIGGDYNRVLKQRDAILVAHDKYFSRRR